jgi:hypothetical protein
MKTGGLLEIKVKQNPNRAEKRKPNKDQIVRKTKRLATWYTRQKAE